MPSVSFVADDVDFKAILAYLNGHPEVAFIVPEGPSRWRAVPALERLDGDRIALWHTSSGPLPRLASRWGEPDSTIEDPWSGWQEEAAGADPSVPYFGPGHPGVIWLLHNPDGPGTRHGVGVSGFEWIGNRYSIIGHPALPATEKFWMALRRWLVRSTTTSQSTGQVRAFPSAMARIRDAEQDRPHRS